MKKNRNIYNKDIKVNQFWMTVYDTVVFVKEEKEKYCIVDYIVSNNNIIFNMNNYKNMSVSNLYFKKHLTAQEVKNKIASIVDEEIKELLKYENSNEK